MVPRLALRAKTLHRLSAGPTIYPSRNHNAVSLSAALYCHQTPQTTNHNAVFPSVPARAHFSTTPLLAKKKNKSRNDAEDGAEDATRSGGKSVTAAQDAYDEAFDFTNLERKILKAIEQMTHKLGELKAGGTLNPKVLEKIEVKLDKTTTDTVKLHDVAQLVTKGMQIQVILSDEDHVKPVKSAIQASNLSLAPQGPTEEAPTTLTINIPPPTGESRQAALDAATKISHIALELVQDARAQKHKKLRAMQVAKTVNPDDIQKAHKEMESVVQRGTTQVKSLLETHRKVISR
ncbi:ribosome recycling factor [Microthyrium microscopicum]|uniref:Ribosome recycling factor n=1 Tax=Microthyrium microscopicum TaxID=703497 RepID=A0A6A6UU78_9PEZI|nr:ribosome recycling factor [Microthyrium microscopicum]